MVSDLEIVYIEQDVGEYNILLLKELAKSYNIEITILKFMMPKEFENLPSVGKSKTTFAKFLFSSLFLDDKVVFIDPDTIINGDIHSLDEVELGDNYFAGVIENLPWYHRKFANMSEKSIYINGGVVICNLALWRKCNFEKKVFNYMMCNPCNYNYDQGIINELCNNKIKIISPKYNALAEIFEFKNVKKIKKRYALNYYYSQEEVDEAIDKPIIIHFTHFLYDKPLNKKCSHPYTKIFLSYLDKSPLDKTLEKRRFDYKKKIRKWILYNMPFSIYCYFENILDIRRYIIMVINGKKI
jgi:lipopolysaccharide biosynthesis glycosyltransferase